ncbi:dihydroneopterin aldolase [Corynebacterium sp. HMSC035E02]|uniref:dihydroneopterin aldolase n=1 Tax=Corynebacterium sp. HMSC035E02 TaxID=1715114 RepID=UPI0008A8998F|nr:dihydroneopterin aldolase [Corynebacterium sp. HMSC035E02]OHO55867.1 dihydroneopterin aldolase [Corynebacterium sp. HMSC035E02]
MADRIELTGLECFGYHGVFEEEKKTGQPFIVDITCWLDTAGIGDDLSRTVNYAELADVAADIVEGPSRDLIETVAEEVAETAMQRFGLLHAIEVTIHKPKAPIPRTFADVAVVARRSRKRMAG